MNWYGQWNPPVDEVLFRNYFENQASGTFLECGAADGISLSCCKAFEDIGWKGINIEGSPPHFKMLLSYRPNSALNLYAALSDKDGMAVFDKEAVQKQLSDGEVADMSIRSIRLSTAMKEAGFDVLDMACLDLEGYEPVVLKDVMASGVLPRVICAEYPHCGLDAIKEILNPTYKMDGISFNNAFFSLPGVGVRTPFWGRTKECLRNAWGWEFPERAEF